MRLRGAVSNLALADPPMVHFQRGLVLHRLNRPLEALACYEQAISLKPDFVEAHGNRGAVLQSLGRLQEALASHERALALEPQRSDVQINRAATLQLLRRAQEALDIYDVLLKTQPGQMQVHSQRATALQQLNRHEEALTSYRYALALQADDVQTHCNYGAALQDLNRLDEAMQCFDRALSIDPDHVDAKWNKSLLKLKVGAYLEGWRLYESGWHNGQRGLARNLRQPLWLGQEDIQGKTLFIYPEQGWGDFIQFCRYVPLLQERGARVILETPATVAALLATLPGQHVAVEPGGRLPEFDLHCPVMSLPLACKTTLQTLPAQAPYLRADEGRRAVWRQRLGTRSRTRVGLAWSGAIGHQNDARRSMALTMLEPLLALPLEFHALQKELRPGDAATLSRLAKVRAHQTQLTDFAETAALIQELDLVICVDTCIAHVAGALGKAVWIMLPFAADHRWLQDRSDSPWYPSARLFRQKTAGDWGGVVEALVRELEVRDIYP